VESVGEFAVIYQKDIEFMAENAKKTCEENEGDSSY
jgi:hypothetical protein